MDSKFKLIRLNKNDDYRGQLTFISGCSDIPFEIRRVYYFHNTPTHIKRGGHAHKTNLQLIIAIHGSFEIIIDTGMKRKDYVLNNPHEGLFIGEMIWRELKCFSPESICLVLASQPYHEDDYISDYKNFINSINTM